MSRLEKGNTNGNTNRKEAPGSEEGARRQDKLPPAPNEARWRNLLGSIGTSGSRDPLGDERRQLRGFCPTLHLRLREATTPAVVVSPGSRSTSRAVRSVLLSARSMAWSRKVGSSLCQSHTPCL